MNKTKFNGSPAQYRSFLSWDCGHKTLAWSYFRIDVGAASNIAQFYRVISESADPLAELAANLDVLDNILANFVYYYSAGVADVLCGRNVNDTDDVGRAKALWKFLCNHTSVRADQLAAGTTVIIEHQPSKVGPMRNKANEKSTAVAQQLAFYYAEYETVFIDPKLKNNLVLAPHLRYEDYLSRIKAAKKNTKQDPKYQARKEHSADSLAYFARSFGLDITRDVKPAILHNLADSTMQALAYICREGILLPH